MIVGYFAAEKSESVLFVAAGALAVAASIWLWAGASAHRGMAFPLAAVALIQLAVGASVYLRTDGQVAALAAELERDPAAAAGRELARMERVNANFQIYKYVEIALLAGGIALSFAAGRRELWFGVACGLIAQASLMLLFDLFAERRAALYVEALRRLGA